jgi:prepilin signal peptidase PulO-like enzyme (type II secretory pathway)
MGIEIIVVVLIGLFAGGVVNALADDLPLRREPRLPRYINDDKKRAIHLPTEDEEATLRFIHEDDEKRPLIAWLGIAAFLVGKRTSPNGIKLSWRYPLTELLTVALMVITVLALDNNEELAEIGLIQTIFWLVYMAFFALITIIDIEHKLILFVVIIPFGLIAFTDALLGELFSSSFYDPSLVSALVGGVVGFIVFFLIYNGGFLFTYVMGKIRGKEIKEVAFGYGDVMMATVSGLVLGIQGLIPAMFITVFLGALGATVYLITRRLLGNKYSAYAAIPYGPYIVAATIIVLLYSDSVNQFLVGP